MKIITYNELIQKHSITKTTDRDLSEFKYFLLVDEDHIDLTKEKYRNNKGDAVWFGYLSPMTSINVYGFEYMEDITMWSLKWIR